ncbi:MAG: hypothetical protein GX456_16770 [Verrucomicrobia bacterium]|nr:hypothetical protein [Verrucomicrobiota bacterium]
MAERLTFKTSGASQKMLGFGEAHASVQIEKGHKDQTAEESLAETSEAEK